jgi:hypothetical protein
MGFTPPRIFSGVQIKGMRGAWHFGRERKKKIACRSFVGEPKAERLFGRSTHRRKYNVTNYMEKYSEREGRWGFLRVIFYSAVSIILPSLHADLFIYY